MTTWKQIRKLGTSSLTSNCIEYPVWKEAGGSTTLVLSVKLSSGKSVLSANIVDDLFRRISVIGTSSSCKAQKPRRIAFFFSRHDIMDSLDARTILGSLARQLITTATVTSSRHPFLQQTRTSLDLDDLELLLKDTFRETDTLYIVLDGLDECRASVRSDVLHILGKLQALGGVMLCISMRFDLNIEHMIEQNNGNETMTFKILENNPDIECLIDAQLEARISQDKLTLHDGTLILEIRDSLMRGA
jgi:hypothetical protein